MITAFDWADSVDLLPPPLITNTGLIITVTWPPKGHQWFVRVVRIMIRWFQEVNAIGIINCPHLSPSRRDKNRQPSVFGNLCTCDSPLHFQTSVGPTQALNIYYYYLSVVGLIHVQVKRHLVIWQQVYETSLVASMVCVGLAWFRRVGLTAC
jgi:hypothetical protein